MIPTDKRRELLKQLLTGSIGKERFCKAFRSSTAPRVYIYTPETKAKVIAQLEGMEGTVFLLPDNGRGGRRYG